MSSPSLEISESTDIWPGGEGYVFETKAERDEEIERCSEYNTIELKWSTADDFTQINEVIIAARTFLKKVDFPIEDLTIMQGKWQIMIRYIFSSCRQILRQRYQAWRNADIALDAIRRAQSAGVTFGDGFGWILHGKVVDQAQKTYIELDTYLDNNPSLSVIDLPKLESSEDEDEWKHEHEENLLPPVDQKGIVVEHLGDGSSSPTLGNALIGTGSNDPSDVPTRTSNQTNSSAIVSADPTSVISTPSSSNKSAE
ncbi:uncharacterized protein IL334_000700 [Kwoniella shivajii]|uniref:Uncharacterized protein n=1 Tax=Kwoniella shivajii TaxID=564305 RepID=A0ABZ1CPV4_9TREE|nr:hypothetical protein IL334_000700 [Kwoniella shivajii]